MPRRSRGCEACKKRRIGCDGGQPSCKNCLDNGRTCSGPLQGPLIINQTNSVVSKSQRTRDSASAARTSSNITLPSQPSSWTVQSVAFTGLFFNFISDQSQKPSKELWLVQAHTGGVGKSSAASAVELSIQATSLAYSGSVAKNQSVVREAYRIYGMALQRLYTAISSESHRPGSSSLPPEPSAERLQHVAIVCASVILSIFEAIYPTTQSAYATHLAAAWRTLGQIQEHNLLGTPVIDQVAVHLQFQTLFVMVANSAQYTTAAPEARRWNALGRSRYHQTADIQTRYMIDLFDLADYFVTHSSDCGLDGLTQKDPNIRERLIRLWEEYKEQAKSEGWHLEWTLENDETCYRDAYTSFVIAYFSVSQLLLAVLGRDLESKITEPCDSILRCSAFLAKRNIGCACLRMFFPLTLVAKLSTSPRQRGAAFRYLAGWLREATFTGLSTVAISSVNTHSEAG